MAKRWRIIFLVWKVSLKALKKTEYCENATHHHTMHMVLRPHAHFLVDQLARFLLTSKNPASATSVTHPGSGTPVMAKISL